MAYEIKGEFVKELNGVKAPGGFHYMPNGKLMNDAHHIAAYGYIDKKINSIEMDLKDISSAGESRYLVVNGNGYFSLEIYDNSGNYYNFFTQVWEASQHGSIRKQKIGGRYSVNVIFPENTSSLKNYTVNIIAETVGNVRTTHTAINEHRNEDNSINLNKSTGSNSKYITKKLYSDVAKTFRLSCIAPSKYHTCTSTVDGAISGASKVVFDDVMQTKKVVVGDKITGTGVTTAEHVLVTAVNPDNDNNKEIQINSSQSISDGVTITFTPAFNGVTPHGTDSSSGSDTFEVSTGGYLEANFSLTITAPTGRLFSVIKTPTTADLCAYQEVTFGAAALALIGENTSSDTVFYRWPVDNIAHLTSGMSLDPSRVGGINTTTPSTIRDYITTETFKGFNTINGREVVYDKVKVVENKSVSGVDAYYNDITTIWRNGRKRAQAGNIIFSQQQKDALKSDSSVKIFGHGKEKIRSLTAGMNVEISNVEIKLTPIFVTTSGASSASTTVAVASTDNGLGNIAVGAELSGVNINYAAVNPTVVSKDTNTGAGNMVLSSAQTLESGQRLKIENMSNVVTLTGKIKVSDFPEGDTAIYFDLERFLTSI